MRLLHLTDLHLNAEGEVRDGVDADAALRAVLDTCEALEDIAAVVVSGDVADDGSEKAYLRAREALLGYAGRRGARVVFCVGNHDDRGAFTRVLGSGHLDPDGGDCGRPLGSTGRAAALSDLDGLRLVTLDTLVPGSWYGRLGDEQLGHLRSVLAETTTPAVVALHHPPIDIGVEIQRRVGLADRVSFADLLRPDQVSAVLCGHFHQQICGLVNAVPVWVSPGVSTRIDHLSGPSGAERAITGGSATVVDVTDPAAPLFALLPADDPAAGRLSYRTTVDELTAELAEFGLPTP